MKKPRTRAQIELSSTKTTMTIWSHDNRFVCSDRDQTMFMELEGVNRVQLSRTATGLTVTISHDQAERLTIFERAKAWASTMGRVTTRKN